MGGYPQALLKVVNLQGMLELSEILILVKNPSPKRRLSVNNLSWKKKKIQKENQESECLTVPRLSALASWLVYVWRIRVSGSPTYATRSVTLILTVSIGWRETFTEMDSQIFISAIKQPVAARPQGGGRRRSWRFFSSSKIFRLRRTWNNPYKIGACGGHVMMG